LTGQWSITIFQHGLDQQQSPFTRGQGPGELEAKGSSHLAANQAIAVIGGYDVECNILMSISVLLISPPIPPLAISTTIFGFSTCLPCIPPSPKIKHIHSFTI
jgi:hypothetical protein